MSNVLNRKMFVKGYRGGSSVRSEPRGARPDSVYDTGLFKPILGFDFLTSILPVSAITSLRPFNNFELTTYSFKFLLPTTFITNSPKGKSFKIKSVTVILVVILVAVTI